MPRTHYCLVLHIRQTINTGLLMRTENLNLENMLPIRRFNNSGCGNKLKLADIDFIKVVIYKKTTKKNNYEQNGGERSNFNLSAFRNPSFLTYFDSQNEAIYRSGGNPISQTSSDTRTSSDLQFINHKLPKICVALTILCKYLRRPRIIVPTGDPSDIFFAQIFQKRNAVCFFVANEIFLIS